MTAPLLPSATARATAWLRRRELAFLVVGGINTLVGFAAFTFFAHSVKLPYVSALICAYAVAVVIAFTLHRRFVFRVRGNLVGDFLRFCSVQTGSFLLNLGFLPLLVEVVHLPVLLAQVVAVPLVLAATYFGHLFISFRRPAEHEEPVAVEAPAQVPTGAR